MLDLEKCLKKPKTPYQAFRMAMFLSLTAPTETKSKQCRSMANDWLPLLSDRSINRALKEVQELVALFDYKYGNQSQLTFN